VLPCADVNLSLIYDRKGNAIACDERAVHQYVEAIGRGHKNQLSACAAIYSVVGVASFWCGGTPVPGCAILRLRCRGRVAPRLRRFSQAREVDIPQTRAADSGAVCLARDDDSEDVEEALKLILQQREGAGRIPFTQNPLRLSHYHRFKSLELLYHLRSDPKDEVLRPRKRIPAPAVLELAPAPPNGYGRAAPREVREASLKIPIR
jgi:hypothetical protein